MIIAPRVLRLSSNLKEHVLALLGAQVMLQPLRLLLQLDDALLEPLDLPLQRRPLRLFALELKIAWKFMMRVAGRLSEGAEICFR